MREQPLAPYRTIQLTNFAIEARMQAVANDSCCQNGAFALLAHGDIAGGLYNVGLDIWQTGGNFFGSSNFSNDRKWHTYRLEVHGNSYRLVVDGVQAITTMSNQSLSDPSVGLYSNHYEFNVKYFRIYSLSP